MNNQNELLIKMARATWDSQLKRANDIFDNLTAEQLQREIAPGKNTGIYLFGHLIAVHDALFPLLGLGERLYPELEAPFVENPDKSGLINSTTEELRQYWMDVHSALTTKFEAFTDEQWLEKHTAISAEDFKKEPHRNRLNVLLNRANHLAYHLGQVVLLK